MNRWKLRRNTSRLILVLASLLTLIIIVITGVSSYAVTPDTAFAYIVKFQGDGLTLGTGDIRNRQPVSLKDKLEGNKVLYIPGGNKPWAHLGFAVDYPKDFAQLIVKAGPHPDVSEWSFPCTAKGGLTIAWKRGDEKACKEGVKLQSSSKKSGLPNNNLQASRRLLAQAEDEVTVVPTPRESLLQTADSAAGISIDVLVGDVRVKSAKNPGGRPVKAGERYNYPQDTITPIDTNPIVNSPEMQEFLNPDNWRSPNIPQRIADGFSEQLGEIRTALGQGSPATASNSGNNNPGQSPTASNTRNNNNDLCNSRTVTQPTFSSNSHDGTPYRIWMDFSRGQEVSSAVCGRQYWVKEDPNHPNYQIRYVYLVDGQGKCVVPYLYKETDGGTLEVVRQASECSSGSRPESVASNSSQQPSDLSGTWIARGTIFTGISGKGCFAGQSGTFTVDGQDGATATEFTMTQQGNQLRFPTRNIVSYNNGGTVSYTVSSNGTVSGNQVTITTSGGGLTSRSTGTISNDGNTVTGQSVCQYSGGSATANGSFTWTRKK